MKDDRLLEEAECKKLWEKANEKISEQIEQNIDMMKDKSETIYRLKKNGKYCYKSELFLEKGWCRLAKSNPDSTRINRDEPKWGFCSTSCNIEFMKVNKYYI